MSVPKAGIVARLEDGREFKLSASDWIGEGGEGAVYKKGSLAIKIVEDTAALAKKEPKLRLLRSMVHPLLATPSSLAFDAGGALIGYAMPMIEGLPLARLMSAAWRSQNSCTDAKIEVVGKSMVEAILALHAFGAWGGDINEFNWRLRGGKAVLIDCDSWGCLGHAVSAMMPSIADPKVGRAYGPESDWYALAVLLFGLYAGIHPFRGSAPGFTAKDMSGRMAAGASLMSPGAGWPASVPGPSAVPKGLRPWIEQTLHGSLRCAPPNGDWGALPRQAKPSVRSVGAMDFPSEFGSWAAPGVARLVDGSFFNVGEGTVLSAPSPKAGVWTDPESGEAWWLWGDGVMLRGSPMRGAGGFELAMPAQSDLRFWSGEPFALKEGAWSCFSIRRLGSQGIKAIASARGLSGLSSEDFENCMVCLSMGSSAMLRPMGSGKGAMAIALHPPVPGARIVMASCQGDFELVDWAMPGGVREIRASIRGKTLAGIPGALDWCTGFGERAILAQVDGSGWTITIEGAKPWPAWSASQYAPCCFQGSLWRVEGGGMQAKAYPLAKLSSP